MGFKAAFVAALAIQGGVQVVTGREIPTTQNPHGLSADGLVGSLASGGKAAPKYTKAEIKAQQVEKAARGLGANWVDGLANPTK